MVAGMVTSLLKGFDFEEATLLLRDPGGALAGATGVRSKGRVLRHEILTGLDRGARRIAGRLGVAGAVRVQARGLLPRAVVAVRTARRGVAVPAGHGWRRHRVVLFGFARLIGYAPHEAPLPTEADLDDAGRAIAAQTLTSPFLVYLRDKALLFNDTRTAFVMYGVQGRTWVALGDPVGPEHRARRSHPPVPRTVRRLRRCAGVLRDWQVAPALVRRLRPHVREAGRGSEGRLDGVHARRRTRRRSIARSFAGWRRKAARFACSSRRRCPR